jgi:hypothetical protein
MGDGKLQDGKSSWQDDICMLKETRMFQINNNFKILNPKQIPMKEIRNSKQQAYTINLSSGLEFIILNLEFI